jgi:hypothetical protein
MKLAGSWMQWQLEVSEIPDTPISGGGFQPDD